MNKKLVLLAICLMVLAVDAQNLYKDIGNVQSAEFKSGALEIATDNAFIKCTYYSPSIVQVQISNKPLLPYFSYAVVTSPLQVSPQYSNGSTISFHSDSMQMTITKAPFRISFANGSGDIINEDDKDLGTQFWNDEITVFKKLFPTERFIGLGEKTGPIDKRGMSFTNWNTDDFAYTTEADPLYKTIPFYIGITSGKCYGIFVDNTYRTNFNFGASTNNQFMHFGCESGEMTYYFIYGNSIANVIESYTSLTGRMPMPPLWALGYQQCRWSYFPDKEVYSIAKTFREKQIPCDVIYNDIDYMDKYRIFTFSKNKFPDFKKYTDSLNRMGFRVAVIIDPGISVANDYNVYSDGIKKDVFVKYPSAKLYTGDVWPGACHFPDFTKTTSRGWWGQHCKTLTDAGISGFWNDMNEPAAWGQSIPNVLLFDYDGHPTTMKQAHNVYGMQMTRATYDGVRKAKPTERPFVLTRATYAGGQRYSAVWTGDNDATDEHMLMSSRMIQSLGISGFAFAGADIGGFANDPDKDLYTRWLSIAAYTPFFRCHSMINTRDREPWALGEETEAIARGIISERYRLLPYLYSAFYKAAQSGLPVVRSLCMDYMNDANVYSYGYENQFLLGQALLVCPVRSKDRFTSVYLPKGKWYGLSTNTVYEGGKPHLVDAPLHRLPVFAKAGELVLRQSLVQHTMQQPADTLELTVYGGDSISVFEYYEDDGISYHYQDGTYYKRNITIDCRRRELKFEQPQGTYISKFKFLKIEFIGTLAEVVNLIADGKKTTYYEDKVKKGVCVIPFLSKPFTVAWMHLE